MDLSRQDDSNPYGNLITDNVAMEIKDKIEIFLQCIHDKEAEIRHIAIKGLVQMDTVNIIDPLINILQHSDPFVVSCAINALGDLGGEQALSPLKEMLLKFDPSHCGNEVIIGELQRAIERIESRIDS